MADRKALQPVDFLGIGNLLDHLVAEDVISCDERDRIIQRIARGNGFTEVESSILAGYGRSKDEAQKRTAHARAAKILRTTSDEEYLSLTEIVQVHSSDAPGYVIQSWLRSENTLAFLNLWEKENNPSYCEAGYRELLKKKRTASFTLTPKRWIDQTKSIGIVSKQGKSGGIFAHPMIACEFASWLTPEFKMMLLKLSLIRERLK